MVEEDSLISDCCIYAGHHLFDFEDKDEDLYGSGRSFGPIETNVNIYLIIVCIQKSFCTQTKLPVKLVSMGPVGPSEP